MNEHSTKSGKVTGPKPPKTLGKAPGGAGMKSKSNKDVPGSTFTFPMDSKKQGKKKK